MALQKPYNINTRGNTYDGNEQIKVIWQVSGDSSVAYQVRVYKNSDSSLTYDSTKITSFGQTHTIPSGSLTNGLEYKILITIWNNANQSISSDYEIFQTSSRPVITLDAIPLVGSPSYTFEATYSQSESVEMKSWIAYLYNENNTLIAQSPISTSTTLSYLFGSFESGKSYFVEFQASSNKSLVGSSGKIPFNVEFEQPIININLTAENVDNGGVKLSWKTIQIIGETIIAPIFIGNDKINLHNDVFSFSEGFSIPKNFTIKIWLEDIEADVDLFRLKGNNGDIYLQYWSDDHKFHLFKDVYGYKSHWTSEQIDGFAYFVCLQQINGDMNIETEVTA